MVKKLGKGMDDLSLAKMAMRERNRDKKFQRHVRSINDLREKYHEIVANKREIAQKVSKK